LVESSGDINLSDITLEGRIVIKSDTKINISKSTRFKDVIFYAPVIQVEDDSFGSGQFIASDSIYIGENCNLSYPTVIGIIAKESNKPATVQIGENCRIKGAIFAFSKNNTGNNLPYLSVKKNCTVWGRIMSNGYSDVKGKLIGNLITYKTILKTNSAVYENHLLNTQINPDILPEKFVNVKLLNNESNHPSILKWLD